LTADGTLRGPDLPANFDWHERTVAWYATWRRSPMAATFIDADWDFLIDTAMLHSQMWQGETKHAAEIRMRVGKLAGTPEDRLAAFGAAIQSAVSDPEIIATLQRMGMEPTFTPGADSVDQIATLYDTLFAINRPTADAVLAVI
jgi:hypothetical protein